MIEVARRSGAPLHLSHLKSLDPALLEPLLELVEAAGVTFDQYPYGAGSTLLASLLPAWAQEGGAEATLARARDRSAREQIARDVETGLPGWENQLGTLGPESIVVGGRTIAELGGDPVGAVLDLLVETELAAQMILHYASDEAVRTVASTGCSSSARTASSASTRIRGSTARRRASSAASFSARDCCRWRKGWRG